MDTATAWVGLRLDPLDTLFFRDGRPFDAATRASGGLPQPQTLAGALRTALLARTGFDFAKFARARRGQDVRAALTECGANAGVTDAAFRGPWLALASSDKSVSPLLPMPEVLKRAKGGGWSVAKPVASVPGWPEEKDEPLRPLWRKVQPDPKADAELLKLEGLMSFLNGKEPTEAEVVKRDELFGFDHRVGIEVDKDTLTSADGMLYVISLLAMRPKKKDKPEVCLYAEMTLSTQLAEKHLRTPIIVPFGGEGKYVQVKKLDKPAFTTPMPTTGSAMWYLATPTFFPPTGPLKRPLPTPKDSKLVAAASGAGVPISGWDVARNGPRATRFAVPAGACYFVDGGCSADDFLRVNDDKGDLDGIQTDALRQEGWGFALPGTWDGKLEYPTK